MKGHKGREVIYPKNAMSAARRPSVATKKTATTAARTANKMVSKPLVKEIANKTINAIARRIPRTPAVTPSPSVASEEKDSLHGHAKGIGKRHTANRGGCDKS